MLVALCGRTNHEKKFGFGTPRLPMLLGSRKEFRNQIFKVLNGEWHEFKNGSMNDCPLDEVMNSPRLKNLYQALQEGTKASAVQFDPFQLPRGDDWFDQAEQLAAEDWLTAIVSLRTSLKTPKVLSPSAIADEEPPPLWEAAFSKDVRLNADEIAETWLPLAVLSPHLQFIWPHFDPRARRHFRPLISLLRKLGHADQPKSPPSKLSQGRRIITVHCFGEHGRQDFRSKDQFDRWVKGNVAPHVPVGHELRFMRWKQRDGGALFRERACFSEVGGIKADHFDDYDQNDTVVVDHFRTFDVIRPPQLRKIQGFFQPGNYAFDKVDQPTSVIK